MPEYTVDRIDYPAVREKSVNPEPYAFFHSSEFKKIFSVKKREAARKGVVDGYLTICSCSTGCKIRLQYKSWGVTAGKVMLSDGNLYALGIYGEKEPKVKVGKCHPLLYHYHRADTLTKAAFWIGILSLVLGIIMDIFLS